MAVGLGTAIGYLNLDISGFANGIDSAISDMDKLGNKVKTASDGMTTIGNAFTKTGAALTAGVTAPIVGFGAASVKAGSEFDSSMSRVGAVAKATGEDFQTIRDRAIEMGEKTRYSATEVSDAMYYMGLAGWDAQQIYAGIPGVLALGAASGEDLSRVSDIVTDSLTAFGKSAEDTSEFVNVLAEASRSSNTTVDALGESFKYVAPVAGAFGYSLQDTAVALGIFANNGIKGSQAGTGLRQALNALINPSDKAALVMDEYGVSLFNADGSAKDLMTVMEELRGTFGDLAVDIKNADGEIMTGEEIMEKYGHSLPSTEMEKLTALVQMFGVRALPGMLSVINASQSDFDDLTNAIYGAQDAYDGLGTVFGMQQQMLDNLQGDWFLFTSALGTTKILISDMAKGALRELLQSLTELVNKFNSLDEEQREDIIQWALIAAAVGPVLVVIGKTITGIVNLVNNIKLLKSAFGVIGPVVSRFGSDITGFISLVGEEGLMGTISGLTGVSTTLMATIAGVVAVVGVLIAAFVNLWKTNEEFRNNVIEIWNGIKAKFEEAGQKIVDVFNELGFEFEDFKELMDAAIEGVKKVWDDFCTVLAPAFVGAFKIVADTISGIVDLFTGVIEIIVGIVKGFKDGDWSMVWQGISDVVSASIDIIVGFLDNLGETAWNVVQTIANLFGTDWGMTWEEAKVAVQGWFDSLVQWFVELPGKIGGFLTAVGEFVTSIPAIIGEFFSGVSESTSQWAGDMVQKAIEMGTNFLAAVGEFFSQLPYNIGYFIGYALATVVTWVSEMIAAAIDMGTRFLESVVRFFQQLPGNIHNFVTSAFDYVVRWASNMISKAREMGQNFLNNVVTFFQQLPGRIHNFITSAFNNVVRWASDMANKAREMGQNFLNNVSSTLSELPGKVQQKLSDALSKASQWVKDMGAKGLEAAKELINSFIKGAGDLISSVKSIGENIVSGVWSGIVAAKDKFVADVKGFFSGLVDGVKDGLGISSPSRVFRDQVGRWIPPGIAEGFADAMPALVKDMQRELDDGVNILSTDMQPFDLSVDDFVQSYMQAFEGLVIWFESLEDRMSSAVDSLMSYFRYLMYVRRIIGNDSEFKTYVFNGGGNNNTNESVRNDIPNNPVSSGGDTYIFQSPKPIDEVQAARMLRNTKRDLAEGF